MKTPPNGTTAVERLKDEVLVQLYQTKEGREAIVQEILKGDSLSIADIVLAKENAMNETINEYRNLNLGMGIRASLFLGKSRKKDLENVKPLLAEDILKTGVLAGSAFEKTLRSLAQGKDIEAAMGEIEV